MLRLIVLALLLAPVSDVGRVVTDAAPVRLDDAPDARGAVEGIVERVIGSAPALPAELDAVVDAVAIPEVPLALPLPEPVPAAGIVPDPFAEHRSPRRSSRDRAPFPEPADEPPETEVALAAASRPLDEPPVALDASATIATVALGITALVATLASLYSRFQRRSILRAPARAALHERIAREPGASVASLAEALGMSRGAVVHHLQMLERHGVLVGRSDGLHRRFYLAGHAPPPDVRPATAAERRVLEILAQRGPLAQADIARELGVTRQAAHEQVRRLERDGRIVPVETGGRRRWMHAR